MPPRIVFIIPMIVILAAAQCPAGDADSACAPTPITIIMPSHGLCVRSDTVILIGTIAPGIAIREVSINGMAAPVRRGIFSAIVPLPAAGHNIITVTARTAGGTTFTAGTIVDRVPFALPAAIDDLIQPVLDEPAPPLDQPPEPQYDGRTLAMR